MTLDLLDRAFLEHFAHESSAPSKPVLPESTAASAPLPMPIPAPVPAAAVAVVREAPLLERLMATVPQEWRRVAEEVEDAYAAGCRVIAVTGSHPREGRTTLARGLVRALSDRGHRVALVDKPPVEIPDAEDGGGPADIVIVDAGIWFPNGSFQRQLLARLSFGCDAAILVSRADRGRCGDYEEPLAATGLRVIGEVTTFSRPIRDGDPEHQHG
jgi:hypothetical protein